MSIIVAVISIAIPGPPSAPANDGAESQSVTVPLSFKPNCGVALASAVVNGKPATVAISIEVPDSMIFGSSGEVGEPSDVDVAIGGLSLGRIAIGSPNTNLLDQQAQAGITGDIGYNVLKQYALGFDYHAGTLTLWKHATRDALLAWAGNSALAGAKRMSFESRGPYPVVVNQTIGGKDFKIDIGSNQAGCLFDSGKVGTGLSTQSSVVSDRPIRLAGQRLLRYAFPGGPTTGWTWFNGGDYSKANKAGVDGLLGCWFLGSTRVVVDGARRELDYTDEPPLSRFLGWLETVIDCPLAADDGHTRWDKERSWMWADKSKVFSRDPSLDPKNFTLLRINDHKVEDLLKLFESPNTSAGNALQAFIEELYASDPVLFFDSPTETLTYVLHWA